MFGISLLFSDPVSYIIIMMALMFGLTIHEYFHGWVAYMLGDDTAKVMGRLTVNPMAHFDPVMTSMIFIVGLGAAKPVPVNPYKVRHGNMGMLMVSAAGIVANFVVALVCALLLQFLANGDYFVGSSLVFVFLRQMVIMNLVLLAFNLLPLPPLDGSKILLNLIPEHYKDIYNYFAHNQLVSLIVAIMVFSYFGVGRFIISFFLKIINFIAIFLF